MREGEIIVAHLQQAHGDVKLRPVLLLKQMPGYKNLMN